MAAVGAIEDARDPATVVESPTADELEGSPLPLLDLIEQGDIDPPEAPLSWSDWTLWRSGEGRRPRTARNISQRESRLWRAVMVALFGGDWQQQVAAARRDARAADEPAE